MANKIEIKCQGSKTVSIDELIPLQGNLKNLSTDNYARLKQEILELGFSEPISVWASDKLYVLNGHQRLRTLQLMQKEGFTVPKVPVSEVLADNLRQAKQKILALTSQYGEMTNDGLYQFLIESDIKPNELENNRFPEIDMDHFLKEFFVDKSKDEIENDVPKEEKRMVITCPKCGHRW